MTRDGTLRAVAALEATSYLVLLGAVISYRVFDGPDITSTVGLVHGLIFLVYFAVVLAQREERGWGTRKTIEVLVAAVVPVGGYVVAHRVATEAEQTGRPEARR